MFVHFLLGYAFTIIPDSHKFSIEETVIDNQLCKGYFKPIGGENCTYKTSIIRRRDPFRIYINEGLSYGIESWFCFNLIHNCSLDVNFEAVPIDKTLPFKPGKITFEFIMEIDTFNVDVAKKTVIDPAIMALQNLEMMTVNVLELSVAQVEKFSLVHVEYRRMLRFTIIVSLLVMCVLNFFMIFNVYKTKRFFKRKKLI